MSEKTHLTRAYRYAGSDAATGRILSVAVTACGAGGGQVSIYPDGAGEDRIDCEACLAWLAQAGSRLLILDVNEWIRRNAATSDIRCIDIPAGGDEGS